MLARKVAGGVAKPKPRVQQVKQPEADSDSGAGVAEPDVPADQGVDLLDFGFGWDEFSFI